LKKEIREILDVELADTVKARILLPDGTYRRKSGKTALRSQEELYKRRKAAFAARGKTASTQKRFIPRKAPGR
jgi:polyphosphate kinase